MKEEKISMLVHKCELFKVVKNETIAEMFTRFTNITNSLKTLGKVYTNAENVKKILWSLLKQWAPKVTVI